MVSQAGQYLNPSYRVILKTSEIDPSSGNFMQIEGFLPESLSINLTSSWDSLLKNMLSGDIFGSGTIGTGAKALANISDLLGLRTAYSQISTFPTWTGTEPIEFSIPFKFDAISDTNTEVYQPWVSLMKVLCPSSEDGGTFLTAPGPQFRLNKEAKKIEFSKDRLLSLKIGNLIYIRGVIVTAVNNTLYSKFDINGKPISAQSDVTLRTIFSPTVDDITNWFSCNENYNNLDRLQESLKNHLNQIKSDPIGYAKGLGKDITDAVFV